MTNYDKRQLLRMKDILTSHPNSRREWMHLVDSLVALRDALDEVPWGRKNREETDQFTSNLLTIESLCLAVKKESDLTDIKHKIIAETSIQNLMKIVNSAMKEDVKIK